MTRDKLFSSFESKYEELKQALNGNDLKAMRKLALETHAMVHPAEISGGCEKTIADYVLDYMMVGNQNVLVPRENYDTDLHYAGTKTVPLCWQFWHTGRIEDLVSNFLMADCEQIFNEDWQRKIGTSITDTGNALDFDEAVEFGKRINIEALRDYIIAVGKSTRDIIENLTLEQIQSMVPSKHVINILEAGGVTTDVRSVWLLVYWGRLTMGGMILTPMTNHYMMHLPVCIDNLPILG